MAKPLTDDQLAEMRHHESRATKGPWRWWTSNSFRRLSSDATGRDGDVLHATIQPSDGHPDIVAKDGDRWFIEKARTYVPALLDEVTRLKAREAALCEAIRAIDGSMPMRGALLGVTTETRDAVAAAIELTEAVDDG